MSAHCVCFRAGDYNKGGNISSFPVRVDHLFIDDAPGLSTSRWRAAAADDDRQSCRGSVVAARPVHELMAAIVSQWSSLSQWEAAAGLGTKWLG
jgi:hypothetical protein